MKLIYRIPFVDFYHYKAIHSSTTEVLTIDIFVLKFIRSLPYGFRTPSGVRVVV